MIKEHLLKELDTLKELIQNDEFSTDDLEQIFDNVTAYQQTDKGCYVPGREWIKYLFTGWWVWEGHKETII